MWGHFSQASFLCQRMTRIKKREVQSLLQVQTLSPLFLSLSRSLPFRLRILRSSPFNFLIRTICPITSVFPNVSICILESMLDPAPLFALRISHNNVTVIVASLVEDRYDGAGQSPVPPGTGNDSSIVA